MFYLAEVEDHIRVEPRYFGLPTQESVERQLNEEYIGKITKDLGAIVSIVKVDSVGEGVIIPGDGATFYKSKFKLLVWKPEMHELVYGKISEIANFGAFINLGVLSGMVHISQTMEDYVSLSKVGTLHGKSSKRSLAVGDKCVARIVAVSYKAGEPKIGLTMRQPGLGKVEWLDEKKKTEKSSKTAEKGKKKGGKKK